MSSKFDSISREVRYHEEQVTYYTYLVTGIEQRLLDLNSLRFYEKHELSIGINHRLCSIHSGMHIATEEIAHQYLQASIEKWRAKWGDNLTISIVTCTTSGRKTYLKLLKDNDTVRTRLKM